jgi:hypothetical protein
MRWYKALVPLLLLSSQANAQDCQRGYEDYWSRSYNSSPPELKLADAAFDACIYRVAYESLLYERSPQEFHGFVIEECKKEIEHLNEVHKPYSICFGNNMSDNLVNIHIEGYRSSLIWHSQMYRRR